MMASAASSSPTILLNITHTTTGATGIGTATGLPAGVSASWANNTITISGRPTQVGIFNYRIPLIGGCGSVLAEGRLVVVPLGAPCPGFDKITDIDGNIYNTTQIGTQCWMKENVRVTRYNDGTLIPLDETGGASGTGGGQSWSVRNTGARTIYGQNTSSLKIFGYLYNWYAAKGIAAPGGTSLKNLCPTGWHVPTDAEWTSLSTFLGGEAIAGGKMKSVGTALWSTPNTGATNESGFTGLPGGLRAENGAFRFRLFYGLFWSSTEFDSGNAWNRTLNSGNSGLESEIFDDKRPGYSIRCLKD